MKKKGLLKRSISVTLATLFFVSFPLQVFAADVEMALPESYEGINEEEVEQQEALSDDELEQTLTFLQQSWVCQLKCVSSFFQSFPQLRAV